MRQPRGQNYFNAARTNGLGFWRSSIIGNAGAFVWECCGETHPMSWNDMISTGIGGMARGEWAYRISSLILDNTKTGWRRYMREFAALPFNPIRTGNRFETARSGTRRSRSRSRCPTSRPTRSCWRGPTPTTTSTASGCAS